ncbi:MAG: ATP-dependent sacrificial sulfur transferase LarE [Lachnospiraceae bacterium]|nr:ATP-dependent sacrificial sulfur transferase LarE [Lachnospiraceae bacterium]
MNLKDFFAEHPKCALAFSGGTDSAYLLYAAIQYGCDIRAYFMRSVFQPEFEYQDARKIAEQLGVSLQVVSCPILEDERIRANPTDRCYYCKQKIFAEICRQASADGYPVILDGTNASDDATDRPGMKALVELDVLSPLRMCGITKNDVRRFSKEAGLFTYQKPSYACLATRIATGQEIRKKDLQWVEQAESALMDMGFRNFRVRMYRYEEGVAALETEERQWQYAQDHLMEIQETLRPWFRQVILEEKYRDAEEIP